MIENVSNHSNDINFMTMKFFTGCFLQLIFILIPLVLPGQSSLNTLTGNQTPEYDEIILHYNNLADSFENCRLIEVGKTDVGKPLHLFIINDESFSSVADLKREGKVFLLINNGIHPGEPDGINSSILWSRKLLKGDKKLLKNTVIGIVPVYNVDGCLNRGKYSRANQDGPEEYGFRGNARNLDLNRDFIKCDSENARSFSRLFHLFNPHLLIDTHVSNGADYQYTMTFITSQLEKLDANLKLLALEIEQSLYKSMKTAGNELCPYVNTLGEKPESGIADFLETPRFATGYAALFNVLGFTTETHMLKPFPQRVKATSAFFEAMLAYINSNAKSIIDHKDKADKHVKREQEIFYLNYKLDTTQFNTISFKGYEGSYQKSNVSGLDRLFYDRTKPYIKKVKYFRNYEPQDSVSKPFCFIIPQAWHEVITRLELNGIEVYQIKEDTTMEVTVQFIEHYETVKRPYEGHYLHSAVKTHSRTVKIRLYAGDRVVFTGTEKDRYLMETLEPRSMDSFFAWNFFDEILQQKEWFSDYVFEDVAAQLLKEDPALKSKLEEKKKTDSEFASDAFAQLYYIYNASPYKESTHNLYPVYRVENANVPETVIIKKITWR